MFTRPRIFAALLACLWCACTAAAAAAVPAEVTVQQILKHPEQYSGRFVHMRVQVFFDGMGDARLADLSSANAAPMWIYRLTISLEAPAQLDPSPFRLLRPNVMNGLRPSILQRGAVITVTGRIRYSPPKPLLIRAPDGRVVGANIWTSRGSLSDTVCLVIQEVTDVDYVAGL